MADKRDYLIIDRLTEKSMEDNSQNSMSNAFYYVALNIIFGLDAGQARDCITDLKYITDNRLGVGSSDSGIDAIYFAEKNNVATIHLFNFKYAEKFSNNRGFPSSEINNIESYVNFLVNGNENTVNNFNTVLQNATRKIFYIAKEKDVQYVVHLCSNMVHKLTTTEEQRMGTFLASKDNFRLEYNLLGDLINRLFKREKALISGVISVEAKNMFAEAGSLDGKLKTIIVKVGALNLMKLICDDVNMRKQFDLPEDEIIKNFILDERAFDNNVRIFLGGNKINNKIKTTAEDQTDNVNFFLYNNGITILCSEIKKIPTRDPLRITLTDLQIVNGSQTLHTLYSIGKLNPEKIRSIDVLCKIFAIEDKIIHSHIAEYTNTQNPVTPRDIKALDYIQIQLEKEFEILGYKYERKKNQYKGSSRRIDNEKIGQAMLSFYLECPDIAKNNLKGIFTDENEGGFYDKVFDKNKVCADYILDVNRIYEFSENKRKTLIKQNEIQNEKIHLKFSSLYLLHGIKRLIDKYELINKYENDPNHTQEMIPNYKTNNLDKLFSVARAIYDYVTLVEINFYLKHNWGMPTFGTFYKNARAKNDFNKIMSEFQHAPNLNDLLELIEEKIKNEKEGNN